MQWLSPGVCKFVQLWAIQTLYLAAYSDVFHVFDLGGLRIVFLEICNNQALAHGLLGRPVLLVLEPPTAHLGPLVIDNSHDIWLPIACVILLAILQVRHRWQVETTRDDRPGDLVVGWGSALD